MLVWFFFLGYASCFEKKGSANILYDCFNLKDMVYVRDPLSVCGKIMLEQNVHNSFLVFFVLLF